MIIELKLYELANKSYSHFSIGMQKCMKSLLKPWQHPVRSGYLSWSYGPVIEIKQFIMLQ